MTRRIRNRLLIALGITLFSVYLFAGFPPSVDNVRERIRLGLDLSGGTHLVLEVVTEDALRAETDLTIDRLRQVREEENILFRQVARTGTTALHVVGLDPARDSEFRTILDERFSEWNVTSTATPGPRTYTLQLNTTVASTLRDQSVDQAIQTIRNRIDQLGVTEPTIQKHGGPGEYEILVQLPGVDDPERVKDIMQSTALLELKLVDNSFVSEQAGLENYSGGLPASLEMLPSAQPVEGQSGPAWYVVERVASISGRDLRNAYPSRDENGLPAVSFTLTADAAQRFGRSTEQNVGRQLAIVLDGKVQSAPRIESRITSQGQITGSFTLERAQDLALTLRSGALPASIRYLEERVVGPSLGADSIRQGVLASMVALGFVVAFMLFYYRMAGVNATVSMVLNLIVLFGALAYFQATLTLPGIAGVILTIGVGIDSNILIFERIREELRSGKTAVSSVITGFKRVFITIVDTHLSALIAAIFLFLFGTGPVKGFAVTLVIGLVANVFTAVFVSRTLFEWLLSYRERAETLSI